MYLKLNEEIFLYFMALSIVNMDIMTTFFVNPDNISLPDFDELPDGTQEGLNHFAQYLLLHPGIEESGNALGAFCDKLHEAILKNPDLCSLENYQGEELYEQAFYASLWFILLAHRRAMELKDRMPTAQTGSTLIN